MKLRNIAKYTAGLTLAAASTSLIAAEDAGIIGAVTGPIADAGDTAKGIILLLIGASVVVMAGMWAWKMTRRGGGA